MAKTWHTATFTDAAWNTLQTGYEREDYNARFDVEKAAIIAFCENDDAPATFTHTLCTGEIVHLAIKYSPIHGYIIDTTDEEKERQRQKWERAKEVARIRREATDSFNAEFGLR